MTMDRGSVEGFLEMEDEYANEVDGTFSWSQTVLPDDTVTFIADETLRYGTHYTFSFSGNSATGIPLDYITRFYDVSFITKPSYADATPPTVETVYPYDEMTGVPTTTEIVCKFSEAMNPDTINSTNIILSGPGIGGPGDYTVNYDFYGGVAEIWKNTPLAAFNTYSVTITTAVKDERGNWLENQYMWSFETGPSDTTNPTVTQTIPVSEDTNVGANPWIYAVFSEAMDEDSFYEPGNITLYDNTSPGYIDIAVREAHGDLVQLVAAPLQYEHNYTVTIATGVRDRAGNGLLSPYSWSFTVVSGGGKWRSRALLGDVGR